MKTIFIPVQNRPQARNILRTDILKTLLSDKDIQVVLFAPIYKVQEYKKELDFANLRIEGIDKMNSPLSRIDIFFNRLSLFYNDNPNARFLRKQWLIHERKNVIRYIISVFLLSVFGNIRILRSVCRSLDLRLVKDNRLDKFFTAYNPELVFSPSIISNTDRSFLRHAKRRGIKTAGMINAWDNITLSKYPFRILPDKLIVYNKIIEKEAIQYLDIKAENIMVSGMPHFDHYVDGERTVRGVFCEKLKLDEKKRLILFASIGSVLNSTEPQVLSILDSAISEGRLPEDIVIIFRRHPTERTVMMKMNFSEHIIFDDSKTLLDHGPEARYSEILRNDMEHLADSIYHSAVTINTASTMSIDASAFDKPVINIAFDGLESRPFHESVSRFYAQNHVHYQSIVKSGGVKIARTSGELISYINTYLANPRLDSNGRKKIIKEHCFKLDGKAGERIGTFILSLINSA